MWENLKIVWRNLPVVLSETDDPKDVSLNRVAFFLYTVFVIASPFVILWFLSGMSEKFLPYWQGVAALLGGQTFANIGKKMIYAWKGEKTNEIDSSGPRP